ncbi:MAG: AEC family transporter [Lentisphaeria bacterium]|nr:AEC family transporter [Lentisphaeria bacterium]
MSAALLLKVFWGILKTFAYFGLGGLALRLKYVDQESSAKFGRFVVDMLFPLYTFYCIVTNFHKDEAEALWQLPALGLGIVVFNMLCGFVLQYGMRFKTPRRKATFVHLATMNNYVFLPLILLQDLYGEKAVAYLLLFSIGSTIGFWTCGVATLAGSDWKSALKNIISSNTIAVVLGLICVFCNIPVPQGILIFCKDIGQVAVISAMILTGCTIFGSFTRLIAYPADAVYMLVTRLIILPLLTVPLLKLLPLDPMIANVAILVALMPASCSSALIVRKYGGSADLAGQSIVFSTLCSLITIPLFLYFL